jgi:hypothetical protein
VPEPLGHDPSNLAATARLELATTELRTQVLDRFAFIALGNYSYANVRT